MTAETPSETSELELLTPSPSLSSPSCIGRHAPSLLYSTDGKYIFQSQAHRLRILLAKSGRVLHECTRTPALSALALHPDDPLQLYAAYQDGYICSWDFLHQTPLLEVSVASPILWMASSIQTPSLVYLVLQKSKNSWTLVEFSLKTKQIQRQLVTSNLKFHTGAIQSSLNVETPGDFIVLAAETSLFTTWRPVSPDVHEPRVQQHELHHDRTVTCVAVHPTAQEFSIGDERGQIFRYDPDGVQTGEGVKYHWHAHAVRCLMYSNDGRFLLSGGEECVFVTWQLETGRRAYLPRLSASIEAISRSPTEGGLYTLELGDNVLFQYNSVTRTLAWETRGLARAGKPALKTLPTRQLQLDPVSNALVLNGASSTGLLQFYDPFTDQILHNLQLSDRNQVSRTEDEELPTLVTSFCAFSARGTDLVTLQAPHTAKTGSEQTLCFWQRRVDGSFFVNTSVEAPHGAIRVTNVAFSPTQDGNYVVTADSEGDFKLWQKKTTETSDQSVVWHCLSVVRFRDEPITSVAFSSDGSLLAVAYGTKLTLWEVATHALRRVLISSDGEKIRQLVFPGPSAPYIVLMTKTQVQVWNLLTLSLAWRYTVPKKTMLADATWHDQFLIWMNVDYSKKEDEKQTLLLVFAPHSPVPTCLRVVNCDTKVWSAGFHPRTGDILIFDTSSRIWRVKGPHAMSKSRQVARNMSKINNENEEKERKMLSSMYSTGNSGTKSTDAGSSTSVLAVNETAASSLFDAPAHVLPSMTSLYRSFMDTMLPKPQHRVNKEEEVSTIDETLTSKKHKKRRKKLQTIETQEDDDVSKRQEEENEEQVKRRKRCEVENELKDPETQRQSYSKLVESFRNTMTPRA